MKQLLFSFAIFFSFTSQSQVLVGKPVDSILKGTELQLVTSFPDSVFTNNFTIPVGIEASDVISLEKNSTFQVRLSSTFTNYTGQWKLHPEQQLLILNSDLKGKEPYYVLRFTDYLYLIPPTKLERFVAVCKESSRKHKDKPSFRLEKGGKFYTWKYLVVADLAAGNFIMNWDE